MSILGLDISTIRRFQRLHEIVDICSKIEPLEEFYTEVDGNSVKVKRGIHSVEKTLFNTNEHAMDGINNQADALIDKYNHVSKLFIKEVLCMAGGFDFKTFEKTSKYRILSNSQTGNDYRSLEEYKSGFSLGVGAVVNSYFSNNTMFFEFCDFIKTAKGKDKLDDIPCHKNIALCWRDKPVPDENGLHQKLLKTRFPFKFLWMWANRDEVLHFISLPAFLVFVNSDDFKHILFDKPQSPFTSIRDFVDAPFDNFTVAWRKISDDIVKTIGTDARILSELLSLRALKIFDEEFQKQ